MTRDNWWKVLTIAAVLLTTVAIHYGWVLEPLFGHSQLTHAIHSRLCYIPIAIGAAWFGLRGAVLTALAISLLVQPYIWLLAAPHSDLWGEIVEIIFYFAIAVLTGLLIDRETRIRRKHSDVQLQLERSHRLSLIGQMASGVAHEIKNPLASIKGAVEILGDERTSAADQREFRTIITKEIKRIDGIVQEFLDFGRPKELALRRLDLGQVLSAPVRQLEGQIKAAGLSLQTDLHPGVFVNADEERLHQVILNLILNAIEASTPGGKIAIALSQNGASAVVSISDCGTGIGAADLQRIFDPFYTTKPRGSGLGLAIVKTIIERHGGQVGVISAAGKGTTFRLNLPLARENA